MTTEIQDCENHVARLRRNIADIHSRQDELRRRIEGLGRAIGEIEDRRDSPGFRLRKGELEALIGATEDELKATSPQLEHFRQQLHMKEQECWELRRRRGQDAPTENDLRKAIDDPRYWRDGDPALTQLVSDGFRRLYPDESED